LLCVLSAFSSQQIFMKHFIVLGGLLAAAAVTAADIPVRKVVVFSHQAEIHRSAELPLKSSDNIVTRDGLPWELLDTTLRVQADGGVTVNRVEVENVRERLIREAEAAEVRGFRGLRLDLGAASRLSWHRPDVPGKGD
jgi:hypothetical protein